jgi:branched-subunit amino acid transport protein
MIVGMAVATMVCKATFFLVGARLVFPLWLKNALDFVPVTVLTAIIVPLILAPGGQGLELTWRNPQLVASLVAVAVCAATRHQLLAIAIGLVAFFIWQFGVLN